MLRAPRWLDPDSYEAAAFHGGIEGVCALARRRIRESLHDFLDSPAQVSRAIDYMAEIKMLPHTVQATSEVLCRLAQLSESDGEWVKWSGSHKILVDQLATLPLAALSIARKSKSKLEKKQLMDFHERLERNRRILKTGSAKAELVRYSQKGADPNRRLSAKAAEAWFQEVGGSNGLWTYFLPPPQPFLSRILEGALVSADSSVLSEEIKSLFEMISSRRDAQDLVQLFEGLSDAAKQALCSEQIRLWNLNRDDGLFQCSEDVSRIYAQRAASKMRGSRPAATELDRLASDLFDLHARLNGLEQPDIRNTRNRPGGDSYAFAGYAFRLYRLPWSETSGHLIGRVKRMRTSSIL